MYKAKIKGIAHTERQAIDLDKFGPRTITVDCDVIQADGGTRTAAITGGFVALVQALKKLKEKGIFSAAGGALPLKDFKDIAGDTIDRVYTLPVVLGITKAKLLMGSFLFLLYVASPLVLNARVLFLPAMVLGSITFWIIQKSIADEHSWMAYRKLPGNVLVVTLLYGLFIIFLLF